MQRLWFVSQLPTLLLLAILGTQCTLWAAAQSPFETIGLGAMTVMGNAMDVIESGGAMRKEHSIETPIFSMHSKAEAGVGNAMRPQANNADSSEERRKRDVEWGRIPLKRQKRAPCHTGGGAGGGGSTTPANPSDMAEEIRRQMKARTKRTATRKRTGGGKKSKSSGRSGKSSKYGSRRHRRQTEQDDLAAGTAMMNAQQRFTEKMNVVFSTFANGMQEMKQRVQQAFNAITANS